MKKISVLLASVFLVGCNGMAGKLSVKQALKLHYTPYADGSPAVNVKSLAPGSYSTSLKTRGDHELILRIVNGSQMYVPFEVPSGIKLPESFGNFSASATNGSQNYQITGKVNTQETVSEPQTDYEPCGQSFDPRYCWQLPSGYSCDFGPNVHQGLQQVTFQVVTDHKKMTVDLMDGAANASTLATFSASQDTQYRNYLAYGPCF